MRALPILAVAMIAFTGSAYADGLKDLTDANQSLANEDYQLAILHYTTAIRAADLPAEDLAMSYRQRGIAHFQINRADLAIMDFTSALWLNGLDADLTTRTFYNRGLAYEVLGESKAAIADLTSAIERNPNYAEAYNSRGHVFRKLGQYEQALADFTASYRQGNPEPHLPMYGLALTYEAMGKLDEAKAWYSRALKTKPDFEPAIEKVHPDQVALDAAPVPAIESDSLLPTAADKPALRKEFDVADGETDHEMGITAPAVVAADVDDIVPTLSSGADAQDSLPTLIDEPVPADPEGAQHTAGDSIPQPHPKPVDLEPAAPPLASGGLEVQHVPTAPVAMPVAVSVSDAASLPLKQPPVTEEAAQDSPTVTTTQATAPSPRQAAGSGSVDRSYQIQLGSYASPAIAESEALRLKKEHPDLLGDVGHEVQRAVVGSKTYFRLRGTGLTFVSAVKLCKGLREHSVSCVISPP